MSELHTYTDGSTERRYTRGEARCILTVRLVVLTVTLPFITVLRTVVADFDEAMRPFVPRSIRLITGEFYP
jgi:hypothetical protein